MRNSYLWIRGRYYNVTSTINSSTPEQMAVILADEIFTFIFNKNDRIPIQI